MHSLRTTSRRLPLHVSRITKPPPYIAAAANTAGSSPFHRSASRSMSLFPRFAHDFSPLLRLLDEPPSSPIHHCHHPFFSSPLAHTAAGGDFISAPRAFAPKFDVRELDAAYELSGELPGVAPADVTVEWADDGNTLTVSGRRVEERTETSTGSDTPAPPLPSSSPVVAGENPAARKKQPTVEDEPEELVSTSASATTAPAPAPAADATAEPSPSSSSSSSPAVPAAAAEPKYWVSERSVGAFRRSFSFPGRVERDGVRARLRDGVLRVVVPKAAAEARPWRVEVE